MAVGYFTFDIWLNTMMKQESEALVNEFEFKIFKNEDYLNSNAEDYGPAEENLWDIQLVGYSDSKKTVFSTRNDFCTFEADPDWDDPIGIVTDCILKYLSDGKYSDVLIEAEGGIYVSMPEISSRREKI